MTFKVEMINHKETLEELNKTIREFLRVEDKWV